MPTHVAAPTRISSAGNKPKLIDEYIGRVNSSSQAVSVAHMRSPSGWIEPAQAGGDERHSLLGQHLHRVLRQRLRPGRRFQGQA